MGSGCSTSVEPSPLNTGVRGSNLARTTSNFYLPSQCVFKKVPSKMNHIGIGFSSKMNPFHSSLGQKREHRTFDAKDTGCYTAKEHMLYDRMFMGSNPAKCLGFSLFCWSFKDFLQQLLKKLYHFEGPVNKNQEDSQTLKSQFLAPLRTYIRLFSLQKVPLDSLIRLV